MAKISPPIRVALDTSALRRDPKLRGGGFEALARFAEAQYVDVFIPEVVAEEFKTAPLSTAEAFATARRALKELRRLIPDDAQARVGAFESEIASEFAKIEEAAASTLANWVKRTDAKIPAIADTHGSRALSRYFRGQPPFRAAKVRQDIPDGFVMEAIIDLAAEGELLVVTSDKRLAGALTSIQNVSVFNDVKALIESEYLNCFRQDLLSEYELENVNNAIQALRQHWKQFDKELDVAIAAAMNGRTVPQRITHWEQEREEIIHVDSAGPVLDWTPDSDKHVYLGEGVAAIAFRATLEVSIYRENDPFYNDGYGSSSYATADVAGTLSLILADKDLRRPPTPRIGDELLAQARIELDGISAIAISGLDSP